MIKMTDIVGESFRESISLYWDTGIPRGVPSVPPLTVLFLPPLLDCGLGWGRPLVALVISAVVILMGREGYRAWIAFEVSQGNKII